MFFVTIVLYLPQNTPWSIFSIIERFRSLTLTYICRKLGTIYSNEPTIVKLVLKNARMLGNQKLFMGCFINRKPNTSMINLFSNFSMSGPTQKYPPDLEKKVNY